MYLLPGFTLAFSSISGINPVPEEPVEKMILISDAFKDGGEIPARYTCDGGNHSPPLAWSHVPSGAVSFALLMEDPDAFGRPFGHWVLYNILGTARKLPSGLPPEGTLPDDSHQGMNDFRKRGYGGPCLKAGERHRYRFHLYALDLTLYPTHPLPLTMDRDALLRLIQGHVLGYASLTGGYETTS